MDLQNAIRTAVGTGARKGIGLAVIRALTAEDVQVTAGSSVNAVLPGPLVTGGGPVHTP